MTIKTILTIWLLFLIWGCATVISPSGGPTDKNPPILVGTYPRFGEVNYDKDRVVLGFDEFVKGKKLNQALVVSPTIEKPPQVISTGKTIKFIFNPDHLLDSTTYTLSLHDAIVDNNEGNVAKDILFYFSTGSVIDSMGCSGRVVWAEDLASPKEPLLICAYPLDSGVYAIVEKRPHFITKTDEKGNFKFKYLPKGSYRLFALEDENNNYMYNHGEAIGFLDAPITLSDSIDSILLDPPLEVLLETAHFDTFYYANDTFIDTVPASPRILLPNDIGLFIFEQFEQDTIPQKIKKTERVSEKQILIVFEVTNDKLPPITVTGKDSITTSDFFKEHGSGFDSIYLWLRDSLLYIQDSLLLSIQYESLTTLFTDTTITDSLWVINEASKETTQKNQGKNSAISKTEGEKQEKTPLLKKLRLLWSRTADKILGILDKRYRLSQPDTLSFEQQQRLTSMQQEYISGNAIAYLTPLIDTTYIDTALNYHVADTTSIESVRKKIVHAFTDTFMLSLSKDSVARTSMHDKGVKELPDSLWLAYCNDTNRISFLRTILDTLLVDSLRSYYPNNEGVGFLDVATDLRTHFVSYMADSFFNLNRGLAPVTTHIDSQLLLSETMAFLATNSNLIKRNSREKFLSNTLSDYMSSLWLNDLKAQRPFSSFDSIAVVTLFSDSASMGKLSALAKSTTLANIVTTYIHQLPLAEEVTDEARYYIEDTLWHNFLDRMVTLELTHSADIFLTIKIESPKQKSSTMTLRLHSDEPIEYIDTNGIRLIEMSYTDTTTHSLAVTIDTFGHRDYLLAYPWVIDYNYTIEIDSASIGSIYSTHIRPFSFDFEMPKEEDLGTLIIDLKDSLANGERDSLNIGIYKEKEIVKRVKIIGDTILTINHLSPGVYTIRSFIDYNGNGEWDNGDIYKLQQPEKVIYYPQEITIKSSVEEQIEWVVDRYATHMDVAQKEKEITKKQSNKAIDNE